MDHIFVSSMEMVRLISHWDYCQWIIKKAKGTESMCI